MHAPPHQPHTSTPASCPGAALLEAFASRGSDDALLLTHLSSCDTCRALVQEIKDNNLFLGSYAGELVPALSASPLPTPPLFEAPPKSQAATLQGGPEAVAGYRILHELHRGAQGIVYLAEQESTRRRVAIKMLLRGALATARQRARFELEAQVASQLRHPGIVTVYDSLPLPGGRFALVMEYVEGSPLDVWAGTEEHHITLLAPAKSAPAPQQPALTTHHHPDHAHHADRADRESRILGIFLQLCSAVQYAHQRGVIHRDLKPANILVDRDGRARVLDFGIAKLTQQSDAAPSQPTMTRPGEFAGTLAYASPEQLSGTPDLIDTRTDVYTLGVILYELVTGSLPYNVTGPFASVIDLVLHAPPIPPTTLVPNLDDDLATVIMRCLAKEPARRYQSAAELLADVRRYQQGEAIDAKRESRLYVMRKWAARRTPLVAASISIACALIIGVAAGAYALAQRTQRQVVQAANLREAASRHTAELRQQEAQLQSLAADSLREESDAARHFMANILTAVSPGAARGQQVSMTYILRQAETQLSQGALNKAGPAATAEVRLTLGRTYSELGETRNAIAHLTAARDLFNSLAQQNQTVETHPSLAQTSQAATLATQRANTMALAAATATDALSRALCRSGQLAAARQQCQQALRTRRLLTGENSLESASSLVTLGEIDLHHGRFDDSRAVLSQALSILENAVEPSSPRLVEARTLLAQALWQSSEQNHDQAQTLLRSSLNYYKTGAANTTPQGQSQDHPAVADCLYQLAHVLTSAGAYQEAASLAEECAQQRERLFGPDHRILANALDLAAGIHAVRGKFRDAIPLLIKAASIYRAAASAPPTQSDEISGSMLHRDDCKRELASTLGNLGSIYYKMGNFENAEPVLREWYTLTKQLAAATPPDSLPIDRPNANARAGAMTTIDEVELARARLERLYQDWDKPSEAAKWSSPKP